MPKPLTNDITGMFNYLDYNIYGICFVLSTMNNIIWEIDRNRNHFTRSILGRIPESGIIFMIV